MKKHFELALLIGLVSIAIVWLQTSAKVPSKTGAKSGGEEVTPVAGQDRFTWAPSAPQSTDERAARTPVHASGPEPNDSGILTASNPSTELAVCAIFGRYFTDSSFDVQDGSIVVQRLGDGYRTSHLVPSSHMQTQVVGDELLVTWTAEGLGIGSHVITYGGAMVQSVELAVGTNYVEMGGGPESTIDLIFLDANSGLPVKVRQLTWASYKGSLPDRNFSTSIGQSQRAFEIGESFTLKRVGGENVAVKVWADSYRTKVCRLSTSSLTHFVELEPVQRLICSFEDPIGEPVFAPDIAVGEQVWLSVAGEVVKPIQWGQNKNGTYAEYEVDLVGTEWSVLPLEGFHLVGISDSSSILAGSHTLTFRSK